MQTHIKTLSIHNTYIYYIYTGVPKPGVFSVLTPPTFLVLHTPLLGGGLKMEVKEGAR